MEPSEQVLSSAGSTAPLPAGDLRLLSNRLGVARYKWSTGEGTLTLDRVRDPGVEAEYDIVSFVMAHEHGRVDGS